MKGMTKQKLITIIILLGLMLLVVIGIYPKISDSAKNIRNTAHSQLPGGLNINCEFVKECKDYDQFSDYMLGCNQNYCGLAKDCYTQYSGPHPITTHNPNAPIYEYVGCTVCPTTCPDNCKFYVNPDIRDKNPCGCKC